MPRIITAGQMKAARALLGWSQKDLAERSGVSLPTIKRMELSNGEIGGIAATVFAVITALEAAGIAFIDANGGGAGVRLRK